MAPVAQPSPEGPPPGGRNRGGAHRPGSHRPAPANPRRRLVVRLLLVILTLGLLVGAGLIAGAMWLQHNYDSNIERFGDPFQNLDNRPAVVAKDAQNVLLLGSDSRISAGDPNAWVRGAQRTDAIMIAHIPANRSYVTVTSIPRDSWVNVPGYGMNKINAGFSFGGPALMVKTVEDYTHVHIDHVVILDFTGFKDVTDALGGVNITIAQSTHDERNTWQAGTQAMDGETALKYVRQRHNLPGGDFDRVKRQQNWIRALAQKALSKGTLTNPLKLNAVLSAVTKSAAVDDGFTIGEMRATALSLRDVKTSNITFMTAPVAGTGWSPDHKQAIVLLDKAANADLWKAVENDKVSAWLAAHPGAALGKSVR
jgi:LCP family protein required for cell wall assembly